MKSPRYSLVDMSAQVRAGGPMSRRAPIEKENEDSEMYGEEASDTGRVLSSSGQEAFPIGSDSSTTRHEGVPSEIEVPLYNIKDVSYLAYIYVGSPVGQKAKVVFDTGSNWLTVKSCLSGMHCHVGPKKVMNPKSGKPLKDNNGKDVKVNKTDVVYYWNQSKTGYPANKVAHPLAYGSANLEGYKYQDTVCLKQINATAATHISQEYLNDHFCIKDFRFQTVTKSVGLTMADGILGISPKNYGKHSLLAELKIAGLIEKTQISFSNAFYKGTDLYKKHPDHYSYMIIGGFNASQIVGGEKGLKNIPMASEKVNPTHFWGVPGWGFAYGEQVLMDPASTIKPLNSVIDSGTTLILIP